MNILKKFPLYILFFSINLYSNDISLWKDFNYGMSPSEVLDVISKTKIETVYTHKEVIGFKPTIVRKMQKKPNVSLSVEGYCTIYANGKMKVLGGNSYIEWCFDKPFSRKKIDDTSKLKFIQIKIHDHWIDAKGKMLARYKRVSDQDWYNSLEVESRLLKNCKSSWGVTYVERNEDVLIAHDKRVNKADLSKLNPWLIFFKKDELVDSLLETCKANINSVVNSGDL
tara:strand:- start:209 stop:886 length:678 start_codon:yes stop_codon:yes gene_type:complete